MNKLAEKKYSAASFLPTFLPDETLYSLCARFHHLSGNRLAATTSHQLFGTGTAAMLHDFPTNLATFEVRTEGRLGNVESLARDRSLLKFYSPYQPSERIVAGIEAMAGVGVDRLKFRLGLPSSRIGATHPLKACPKCIQEEIEQLGCAYWHLLQQHPSVWICTRHDELLMQSTGKSKTHNHLQWVLPHTLAQEEWKTLSQRFGKQALLLQRLSEFTHAISSMEYLHFDSMVLRQCYLFGVKNSGWLTRNGFVRLREVRQAFLDETAGLLEIPEFGFIETVDRNDGGFLGKLLRTARCHLHPTKHLLLTSFLFSSYEEFWDCYLEMSATERKSIKHNLESDGKVEELKRLIALKKISLAQAARNLAVPYDIARYWLKRAGIEYVPLGRCGTNVND